MITKKPPKPNDYALKALLLIEEFTQNGITYKNNTSNKVIHLIRSMIIEVSQLYELSYLVDMLKVLSIKVLPIILSLTALWHTTLLRN